MMQNNNFSPIPFYESINEQNHRKPYAYGEIYPLICPADKLLPFQICVPGDRALDVAAVTLCDVDGRTIMPLMQPLTDAGMRSVYNDEHGYSVLVYPASMPLGVTIAEGRYTLSVSYGGKVYYSDVITIVSDTQGYLRLEWRDVEDFVFDSGIIIYNAPRYTNVLYLCAEIGKPDYQFEEEGENRDGYFFATKRLSEKTYKFTFLAPEYMCDALRLARMADVVKITDKYGREYRCDTFLITPKWQTQGDIASVEAEFETNTVAKKIPFAYQVIDKGDFNNDYNNDFNKD